MTHEDVGALERAGCGRVAALHTDHLHELEGRRELLDDGFVALEEFLGPDVRERERPRNLP